MGGHERGQTPPPNRKRRKIVIITCLFVLDSYFAYLCISLIAFKRKRRKLGHSPLREQGVTLSSSITKSLSNTIETLRRAKGLTMCATTRNKHGVERNKQKSTKINKTSIYQTIIAANKQNNNNKQNKQTQTNKTTSKRNETNNK